MKLDLACGPQNKSGYVHHELTKSHPHIDIAWDLTLLSWPWQAGEFEEILALDIIEHLPNTIEFMNQCWRILQPNGKLFIRTPSYDSSFAWIDPTHVKVFTIDTFDFFDPTTDYGKYNVHLTKYKWRVVSKVKTKNKNLEIELEKA